MFNSDSTMVSTEGKNSMLVTKELVEKMTGAECSSSSWGKLLFNLKHFLAASANSLRVSYGHWHNLLTWSRTLATVLTHFRSYYVQGGFFYCSALKMTK